MVRHLLVRVPTWTKTVVRVPIGTILSTMPITPICLIENKIGEITYGITLLTVDMEILGRVLGHVRQLGRREVINHNIWDHPTEVIIRDMVYGQDQVHRFINLILI